MADLVGAQGWTVQDGSTHMSAGAAASLRLSPRGVPSFSGLSRGYMALDLMKAKWGLPGL